MRFKNRLHNLGKPEGLREEELNLTPEQVEILEEQIRKNKGRIDELVHLVDRLVNIERYGSRHPKVMTIRSHMSLLMSENNTFRQNLWSSWLRSDSAARYY